MSDGEEGVWALAKAFYRLKRRPLPRGFGPGHKTWIFFQRTRNTLIQCGLQPWWKTFIYAQFHYCRDRNKLFPNMIYGDNALAKYSWYMKKKKRRMGKVYGGELEGELALDSAYIDSHFQTSAWRLEGYTRRGIDEVTAYKLFPNEFHPLFVAVGALNELKKGDKEFRPKVLKWFNKLMRHRQGRFIPEAQRRYHSAREDQGKRWDESGGLGA